MAPRSLCARQPVPDAHVFNGAVDARIEFHFGLFADNKCRLRDGAENKMLGL
jgi:hypothetical protein